MTDAVRPKLPRLTDPAIVDLFAGPGGLDVAAHWLDVPSIGIELDPNAVATRAQAGLCTVFDDVRNWGPEHFPHANVLTGGPPCQTFTVAGNGEGRNDLERVVCLIEMVADGREAEADEIVATLSDPRTGLVTQPIKWITRAIQRGRPFEAVVLEQVPNVLPIWYAMKPILESFGYGVECASVRTEEYGVPQTRRRALLLARFGARNDDLRLPPPTHQKFVRGADHAGHLPLASKTKWRSMADALNTSRDFTIVSNYGKGGNPRARGERRHDEPAFTVTGKVSRNRVRYSDQSEGRLTADQAGRLQTFPAGYPWSGRDQAQQIGNAIPPRLGAHILSKVLGFTLDLDERFFAERERTWHAPTQQDSARVLDAVECPDIALDRSTRVITASTPEVAASSHESSIMGVVASGATLDAVEPQSRHRAGAAATV